MTDYQSSHGEATAPAADLPGEAPETSSPEDNFSDESPESPATEGGYSEESPETSPLSGPSSEGSNALATQGSREPASAPLSPSEPNSAANDCLDLGPFNRAPAPDAVLRWLPPDRSQSTQAVEEELARFTKRFEGQPAAEEDEDDHDGTGQHDG